MSGEHEVWVERVSDDYPDTAILSHHKLDDDIARSLKAGKRCHEARLGRIALTAHAPIATLKKWDILYTSKLLHVARPDVALGIEKLADGNIQLIPADIKDPEGSVASAFVLVIARLFSVIDRTGSEYSTIEGSDAILGFSRMHVLKVDNAPAIFRDPLYRPLVFTNGYFRDAIVRHGWTGRAFRVAEGFAN